MLNTRSQFNKKAGSRPSHKTVLNRLNSNQGRYKKCQVLQRLQDHEQLMLTCPSLKMECYVRFQNHVLMMKLHWKCVSYKIS
jgi:hypothetical protein